LRHGALVRLPSTALLQDAAGGISLPAASASL